MIVSVLKLSLAVPGLDIWSSSCFSLPLTSLLPLPVTDQVVLCRCVFAKLEKCYHL